MATTLTVGIATTGRAATLGETLRELAQQTRRPDRVVVCGAVSADTDGASAAAPGCIVMTASRGLPRQRNAIVEAAGGTDILVFFDDDFLPDPDYLAEVVRCFDEHGDIVVATGLVLADGIIGRGLTPAEGRAHLAAYRPRAVAIRPTFAGYGCNMAVRLAPIVAHGLRFDERLPLYAWQEDVDLSRALARHGAVVLLDGARGVHLGTKTGRSSGVRLGYSQVANPLYLSGKRNGYPIGRALGHIARNVAMNVTRAFRPEPYVDRRGRLRGNLLAIADLLRGTMLPERVLDL